MKFALENDILDITNIQVQIEMKRKYEYLEMHNHSIWFNENNQKWYTYLDDDSKRGYSLKKRNSQELIEDLVVKYYQDKENDPYLREVFDMWNDERLAFGELSAQTHNRYNNDLKRFFPKNCPLCQKKFRLISEHDLEMFIKSTIHENNMTAKAYSGLRTIIRGMFKYGKRRGFTSISITTFFGDLDLSKRIFQRRVVDKDAEVFNEDEIRIVTAYLRKKDQIRDLGILLAFETGMRVGELSGLKKTDLGKRQIHVQRTEITYKDPETDERICEVRDFPKSEAGDRYLIIPKSSTETINRILELSDKTSEYLFSEQGKRIRANAFNRRLGRVCDDLNIRHKSMHKVRKTYGTTLIDNQVDESLVASQMGHKDISTTKKYYYFCNKNDETKMEQIDKALSS